MGLLDDKWYQPIEIPKEHTRKSEANASKLLKKKRKKTRRGGHKKKRRKPPKMSYRTYITSAYWINRKNAYYGKYGKKCAVCGENKYVQLHHKRYDVQFGQEPDNALVALCRKHHKEFHDNFDLKKSMHKDTNDYIQTAKQLHQSKIDDLSWIE